MLSAGVSGGVQTLRRESEGGGNHAVIVSVLPGCGTGVSMRKFSTGFVPQVARLTRSFASWRVYRPSEVSGRDAMCVGVQLGRQDALPATE